MQTVFSSQTMPSGADVLRDLRALRVTSTLYGLARSFAGPGAGSVEGALVHATTKGWLVDVWPSVFPRYYARWERPGYRSDLSPQAVAPAAHGQEGQRGSIPVWASCSAHCRPSEANVHEVLGIPTLEALGITEDLVPLDFAIPFDLAPTDTPPMPTRAMERERATEEAA